MDDNRAVMEDKLSRFTDLVDELLEMYSVGPVREPPDYFHFCPALQDAWKPFFEYDDFHFHQHDNGDFYFSSKASEVISAKKWFLERWLENNQQRLRRGDTKAVKRLKQYKLLLKYFAYESKDPQAQTMRLFDVQFRLKHETDEGRKLKIRAELEEILGGMAAAKHVEAVGLVQRGDHLEALKKTREALEQFPGATKTAALQVEILEAIKQTTLHGALVEEPRDTHLQFEYSLAARIQRAREALAKGTIKREDFLERLHDVACSFAEAKDLSELEKKFGDEFPVIMAADTRPITFLATGEYILSSFPADADFAPAAVEFAKALELVVGQCVFLPLKKAIGTKPPQLTRGTPDECLVRYLAGGKALTLGQASFVFQALNSQKKRSTSEALRRLDELVVSKFEKESFQELRSLLSQGNIETYRNLAVHTLILPKSEAQKALEWVRQGLAILEVFAASSSSDSTTHDLPETGSL